MSLSPRERIRMRETIRAARVRYKPVEAQSGRKRYRFGSADVNFLCDHLEATLRELDEIDWRIRAGKE
jgi:macrodomain Ter protein organizer (MatP/YcbG family)